MNKALLSYSKLKYLGTAGWAFTYVCFIAIAYNWHWCMIPLVVCAYNISYELLYTILATSKDQRLRNGLWFILDVFIVSNYIINVGSYTWFFFWFLIMIIIQITLCLKITKEQTKAFAWFVTLLMSILMIYNLPPFYSKWVIAALVGKFIGDGFYGAGHLIYGIPGVKKNSMYEYALKTCILVCYIANLFLLFLYVITKTPL